MSEYELGALVVVTPSTAEPITRSEVKLWLKVEEDETADDGLIDGLITMARQRFEERRRRALLKQTFDYALDETPCAEIVLPRSPLISVTSIKGFSSTDLTDTGGTAMSTSGFYVDTAHVPGRVVPTGSFSYPSATRTINAVIVRFTAGYSTSSTGVPEAAKVELKQLVAGLYEHRGDSAAMADVLDRFDQEPSDFDLPDWG